MKFYDAFKPIYLETDALGISLGAGSLQVRNAVNFGSDGTGMLFFIIYYYYLSAFGSKGLMGAE